MYRVPWDRKDSKNDLVKTELWGEICSHNKVVMYRLVIWVSVGKPDIGPNPRPVNISNT